MAAGGASRRRQPDHRPAPHLGAVLHYLAGVACLDERLEAVVRPVVEAGPPPRSQRAACERIAAAWSRADGLPMMPAVQLTGADAGAKRAVAAAASGLLGWSLHAASAWRLPQAPAEIEAFRRLWDREAVLSSSVLLLECDDPDAAEPGPSAAIAALIESLTSPTIVATAGPRRCGPGAAIVIDVENPTEAEQGGSGRRPPAVRSRPSTARSTRSSAQFRLSTRGHPIAATGRGAVRRSRPVRARCGRDAAAWDACRRAGAGPAWTASPSGSSRPRAGTTWCCRTRRGGVLRADRRPCPRTAPTVYDDWGFAARGDRGGWASPRCSPAPAAPARRWPPRCSPHELRLDLYRIDLSQVVSKYIGETEKNLRARLRRRRGRRRGPAVRRGRRAVRQAQRGQGQPRPLRQHRGQLPAAADGGVPRAGDPDDQPEGRARPGVPAPPAVRGRSSRSPTRPQRAAIWRAGVPAARRRPRGWTLDRLARLNVAGGHIRNIALGAAFLAAGRGRAGADGPPPPAPPGMSSPSSRNP